MGMAVASLSSRAVEGRNQSLHLLEVLLELFVGKEKSEGASPKKKSKGDDRLREHSPRSSEAVARASELKIAENTNH